MGFLRSLASVTLIVLAPMYMAAEAADDTLEYPVKATFLYKFIPFVVWPSPPVDTISICVVGNDGVTALIDQAVRGESTQVHPIQVRHLPAATRDANCQIIYFAPSSQQSLAEGLNAVRGTPVLTVASGARPAGSAPIISFVVEDNRVRFDIDDASAAENHLTISSKLLSLARTVRPRPQEAK